MESELLDLVETIGEDFKTFKGRNDATQTAMKQRLDQLEAARDGIGRTASATGSAERKQLEPFLRFCREGGKSKSAPDDWMAASSQEYRDREAKAMAIGSDATGGYAVPEAMEDAIKRRAQAVNPIRDLARVVQIDTAPGAYKVPVSLGGTACGWVGEVTTRSETATPTLARPTFPDGCLYAYPQISQFAADDIPNLMQFVNEEVADCFASTEATAFLTGNASNRPSGILRNAPVSTDDDASPQRASFTLEYLPLDTSSPSVSILAPLLIDMTTTLKAGYWERATWIMNRATLAVIRKLRDTNGQFLWQPSMQLGMPSSLLGFPVRICDAMASPGAAGRLPLLLGDFQRLYTILERPTRVVLDDNITTPGTVKLYFSKRLSGHVVDDHAGKVGKCAAV